MMKSKLFSVLTSSAMVLCLMALPIRVSAAENAASIGNEKYETLKDATDVVKKGETILLENDVTISTTTRLILTGDKYDFTLDLNGHKISQEKSGEIKDTPAPIRLDQGANLTVKDSKNTGEIFGYQTPVLVLQNSSFTLESGTLKGEWYGLSGNGLYHGTKINIKGGSIFNNDPDKTGAAIYHPQTGELTISGGTIKGDLGVQLCAGNATVLEMTGGRIEGTGNDERSTKKGDGAIPDGAAISVVNRAGYNSIPKIMISGGQFVSTHSKAVLAYTWVSQSGKVGVVSEWVNAKDNITIKGGTFNTTPSEYVTSGNKVYTVGNTFKVAPMTTEVKLSSSALDIEVGKTAQLTSTLTPSQTLDKVAYTSSNETVATISETGLVTAKKIGTATITATAGGKTATCTVTVKDLPAEPDVPVQPETPDVPTIEPSNPTTPSDDVEVGIKDAASKAIITNTVDNILKDILSGKDVPTSVMSVDTLKAVKEALASGKTIVPVVENKLVKENEVAKESVAMVNELVTKLEKSNGTKATVAQYLDLGVTLTTDDKELGSVNQLEKPVTFTVTLPKDLQKEGRVFYVVRIHNGVAEKLATTMTNGTVTFQTDKFSMYALVYEEKVLTGDTVKTSDNSQTMLFVCIAGLALVSAGLVVLYKKRDELLNK